MKLAKTKDRSTSLLASLLVLLCCISAFAADDRGNSSKTDASAKAGGEDKRQHNPLLDDEPKQSASDDSDNPFAADADPLAGEFKNDKMALTLVFVPSEDTFSGVVQRSGKRFPLKAKRSGDGLAGEFTVGTKSYPFTAKLDGDALLFMSANVQHRLARQKAEAGVRNPVSDHVARDKPNPTPQKPLPAGVDPFVGTFVGQGAVLQLRYFKQTGLYNGALRQGNKSSLFTGEREGLSIRGEVREGQTRTRFLIKLQGNVLTMTTDQSALTLIRMEAPAPTRPIANTGRVDFQPTLPEISLIRHGSGFTLVRPATWRLKAGKDQALIMVPEDGSPGEMIKAFRRPAPGPGGVEDPGVLRFMDSYTAQFFRELKRTGPPTTYPTLGGPGMVARYEGRLPDGVAGRLTFYTLADGRAQVYLVHVGHLDVVERRERTIRFMFGCFGWGFGGKDEHLVGRWRREQPGSFVKQSQRPAAEWTFTDDGRCHQQIEGDPTAAAINERDGRRREGAWYTHEGVLFVVWDDVGATRQAYEFPNPAASTKDAILKFGDGDVWRGAAR